MMIQQFNLFLYSNEDNQAQIDNITKALLNAGALHKNISLDIFVDDEPTKSIFYKYLDFDAETFAALSQDGPVEDDKKATECKYNVSISDPCNYWDLEEEKNSTKYRCEDLHLPLQETLKSIALENTQPLQK